MQLIDKNALKDAIEQYAKEPTKTKSRQYKTVMAVLLDIIGFVDNAPTVDAYKIGYKHGKSKGIKKGLRLRKDFVRVVRCRDCKWWFEDSNYDGLYRCANDGLLRKEDHYCADGERWEEDDLRMCANHNGERREE